MSARRASTAAYSQRARPSTRRVLAFVAGWVISSMLAGVATTVALRSVDPRSAPDADTLSVLVVAEVYLLVVAVAALAFRRDFVDVAGLRPVHARHVATVLVLWLLAYAVTWAIESAIPPVGTRWDVTFALLRAIGSDDGRLAHAGPGRTALIVVRACLIAPLAEEVLFRGVLFAWLRPRLGRAGTMIGTSAAFAAIHWFPEIMPLAFFLALGAAWLREQTGSTLPAVAAHVIHNTLLVVMTYLLDGWTTRLPWAP